VRFGEVPYVLHAFQKKATRGVATPKREIEAIKARLKQAEEIHQMMAGK
jgi:phage-related protein